MKYVLLLFGGASVEHEVSCKSAKAILENIDIGEFVTVSVGISKDGDWFLYEDWLEYLDDATWLDHCKNKKIDNIIHFLNEFDVVFPIIHGFSGEDGKLQGFLDFFHIPYVGCNTISSAMGMDKDIAKIIFNEAQIPQVPSITISKDYDIMMIERHLRYPMIVKPANSGSSIGINKVNNHEELIRAIDTAFQYDNKIVIENFLKVRELECAILEDHDSIIVSTIGEIKPANEFYDYEAKYERDDSVCIIPAIIDESVSNQIRKYAKRAFQAINGEGMARIDFFLDKDENIYLNEINTLPGFTDISMYAKLLIYDGYRYKDILTTLVNTALTKQGQNKKK